MTNYSSNDHFTHVKTTLNRQGPGFCLAKWTQVTLRLHNGTTHSCHHPGAHVIPLDEIKTNPSALHNTAFKIQKRAEMMSGGKPKECDYCWRIEATKPSIFSDRVLKSGYDWSWGELESILKNPLNPHFVPRNVEVVLSSVCNFKCSYCGPDVSSKWQSEVKQFGTYPTSFNHGTILSGHEPIEDESTNPYIKAFWQWWPELYPQLHTFRVTGGEPLLTNNLYKIMDQITARPNPNLIFAVNTNLCPPEHLWQRFMQQSKQILDSGAVKSFEVYTSAEAWGERAEYIRFGMDFELWRKRLWELLTVSPKVKIVVMATYNALSVSSFLQLLAEVLKIKRHKDFLHEGRNLPIQIDISYLRNPQHQSVKILSPDFLKMIEEQVDFMRKNRQGINDEFGIQQPGFHDVEIHKMERLFEWYRSKNDLLDSFPRKLANRADFYQFFREHDRRRGTDFLATFPEYREFWIKCRRIQPISTALLNSRNALVGGIQSVRNYMG